MRVTGELSQEVADEEKRKRKRFGSVGAKNQAQVRCFVDFGGHKMIGICFKYFE